ncbi:hypothetical protein [Burkholderia cenocepacia]|uniref:hypothetical protein n=1 Tax=Burkholderia cenocepacia TaxID=95486 RepID=UPI0022301945|nr:hypothetical protein [Burkholderia cenocepacia]MCW3539311.1 hypothetical protein [Burkholderia cenocepacia]
MSDDELKFLSVASEQASDDAIDLSDVVSGIGCLISEDQTRPGTIFGSFQGSDISNLLHFIANQLNVIGQMASIGKDADYCLRRRAEAAAGKAQGASRG